uniref:Uncharacterized protein n=1 Tax=Rhizophora mucronata TaxID=61149 RepID=A0A2P2NWY3_RHIMU
MYLLVYSITTSILLLFPSFNINSQINSVLP